MAGAIREIDKGDTFDLRETGQSFVVTDIIKPRIDEDGNDTGQTVIQFQDMDAWVKEHGYDK